jgi:hypothetical protein
VPDGSKIKPLSHTGLTPTVQYAALTKPVIPKAY